MLAGYLIIMNIITYVAFALDKKKAVRGEWRIPEITLFLLALAGGAIGGMLAMRICRHKTRHWSFRLGLPLILIVQIVFWCYIKQKVG